MLISRSTGIGPKVSGVRRSSVNKTYTGTKVVEDLKPGCHCYVDNRNYKWSFDLPEGIIYKGSSECPIHGHRE